MTWATLSIDRRFCGPPGSGNGGYTAGRLAALIGDPAEITLTRPPPLETEMRVERAGSRLLLMHGDDLIAEAQKTVVELAIPECPGHRQHTPPTPERGPATPATGAPHEQNIPIWTAHNVIGIKPPADYTGGSARGYLGVGGCPFTGRRELV